MIGFLGLVIGIGYAASYIFGDPIILYVAIIFSLVMNFVSFWFSDKIALKTSGAVEAPDGGQFSELHNIVENLSITAGLPKPRVYIINDPAPNAFATGRNKENAAVAVTTGLLERLNRTEIEGVIAHELAHIGNRDILVMTVAVVLSGFIALVADFFMRGMFFGRSDDNRGNAIALVVGLAIAILAPIFATLIQMAISRKREFLADATGALLTRYPEGLASALEKISGYTQPVQRASNATAHLYISNPF
jgi:heat shock protein HtpX